MASRGGKRKLTATGRRLRSDAREILRHALEECSPEKILLSRLVRKRRFLEGPGFRFDLGSRGPLIFCYGKASARMARGLAALLPGWKMDGFIVLPEAGGRPRIPGFRLLHASHPVPDTRSFRAGRLFLRSAGLAGEGERIIHLISGGGSALLAAPLRPLVGREEKILLHRLLTGSGLGICGINVVRKHFSALKGGRLLLQAPGAHHLSLILSDVPPGAPESVAGGPTLPDPALPGECVQILKESGIFGELPARLRDVLDRGGLPATPRPWDPRFRRHRWEVVASGADLVEQAASRARGLGYRVRVLPRPVEETVEAALDRIFRERDRMRERGEGAFCLVAGGEARVEPASRGGRGGRAQEMAAAAAERLRGRRGCLFLAAGSDGVDGSSPAAGAMADGETLGRALERGLDPWALRRRGDTYRLFRSLGDSLVTGPTGNNLRDLYLLLEAGRSLPLREATGDRRG